MLSLHEILLLTLFLTTWNSVYSQEKFNYDNDFKTLLVKSKDSTNEMYYPKLLNRFNNNDSTLTDREVIALMIGFTDNVNYKPYQTISSEREILRLVREKKYREAIDSCNIFLTHNPLNFSALIEKGFAYMKLSKDSADFHKAKFLKIRDAVLSTGDGTIDKPYFVLNPIDGQILIKYIFGGTIGTMGSSRDKRGNFLDMLEMHLEGKKPVTLFFNINHATNKMFSADELEKTDKIIDKGEKKKRRKKGG